jgi:lycopene beta-cyclase
MTVNYEQSYDFLFVGMGAANSLLLLKLHERNLLDSKKIAIIEPNIQNLIDRTFCFWASKSELEKMGIGEMVSNSWDTVKISGSNHHQLSPLSYYHVKGISLFNKIQTILRNDNITLFETNLNVLPVVKEMGYSFNLDGNHLVSKMVFDNRPPQYAESNKNDSFLYQSFLGWEIQTTTKIFDTDTVTLMDFNTDQNESCQFVYMLPFSKNRALIELTRFGKQLLSHEEASAQMSTITQNLVGSDYHIIRTEKGVLPMTSNKLNQELMGPNWVNTGTKANLLKSTTGYAFHNMVEDALFVANCMDENLPIERPVQKPRFRFYDRILLKILEEKPQQGKDIFEILFKKIPVTKVLSFLREKTSLVDELKIFKSLPLILFLRYAFKDIIHTNTKVSPVVLSFMLTIISVLLFVFKLDIVSWIILFLGFMVVGLPHGAVDHLIGQDIARKKTLVTFVLKYLFIAALLGALWWVFPDFALIMFLAYSAWHFGQTDFTEWNLKQGWKSFLWGTLVLMLILFFHFDETKSILNQIPDLQLSNMLASFSTEQLTITKFVIVGIAFLFAINTKSLYLLATVIYLMILSKLPLFIAFAIYFIFQHSFQGWKHLTKGLNIQSTSLWLKSAPFSLSGAAIILLGLFFIHTNFSVFFILLSCISLPHVFWMNRFYNDKR